jgi:hypothetical protein
MLKSASSLNKLYTPERAQFCSAFLPTTLYLIQRCRRKDLLSFFTEDTQKDLKTEVAKTVLSFAAHFWQQRSGMLHSFGENGKLFKILNIWANSKKIVENVGHTVFDIYK